MCGIVGFIGDQPMSNVLLGLEALEYRGYDSAGVALIADGQSPTVIKQEGVIERLRQKVEDLGVNDDEFSVAIGHTRWATHGKPSESNAHPHVSGEMAIVHNGIIENHAELRAKLIKDHGVRFVSDTDTEVLAHLINVVEGESLYNRVNNALDMVEGSYALAIVSPECPGEIIVARRKSPLVIGVFDSGAVIASDVSVILNYTDEMYALHDDETAIIFKSGFYIHHKNNIILRQPFTVPWSADQATKGSFSTFMEKEIHEQPKAIFSTIADNDWEAIAIKMEELNPSEVVFVACGTSLYSCMIGAMLVERHSGIKSSAKLASELESTIISPNDLVIAVSQSGETADTLSAIRYVKQQGAKIVAIVNTVGSSIEREADFTIRMSAGPEISVASTKAFSAQVATLCMLSPMFGNQGAEEIRKQIEWLQYNIELVCKKSKDVIDSNTSALKRVAAKMAESKSALYLGRGFGFPLALEGALKLKEISYIHAEGFAAGEMKHGPIALIEEGMPVVVIATRGSVYNKTISNIEEARARGAHIIAIAAGGDFGIANIASEAIYVPDVPEALMPLVAVMPLQLVALYTAQLLSVDVDKPRNLAKSVTVE